MGNNDKETEIFQQALGDATHKPTENWEEEIAPEEAEKTLSTWLPKDNIERILMLCFFLVGLCSFFTPYEWLFFSFLITSFFSPRLRDWGNYERNNRIDSGGGG